MTEPEVIREWLAYADSSNDWTLVHEEDGVRLEMRLANEDIIGTVRMRTVQVDRK